MSTVQNAAELGRTLLARVLMLLVAAIFVVLVCLRRHWQRLP